MTLASHGGANNESPEQRRRHSWPPPHTSKAVRDINDMIYGTVSLYYPLNLIVDTPEFQRLRRLRQVGAAIFVYPNADHSRFAHCLGVSSLALDFVHTLRVQQPELEINDRDELCIAIAGLCHDLGHGPASHVFDGQFLSAVDPQCSWTHEQGSIAIFRQICQYSGVKKALSDYLFDEDFTFIEECINPPQNDGKWLYKGRPIEKSFLYDLISNSNDSFDVDKFDYLLRDSHQASLGIAFNLNSVHRLQKNMRVLFDPNVKYRRICYAQKVKDELLNVGHSRQSLHDNLYQHQTVIACEHLMVKAMQLAALHLQFMGDDGKLYNLAEVYKNVGAFTRADDGIFSMIQNSTMPEMAEAQEVLNQLHFRRLPRLVGSTDIPETIEKTVKAIESELLRIAGGNLQRADFFARIRPLHRGMGADRHPMNAVLVFNNKLSPEQMVPEAVDPNWLAGKSVGSGGVIGFNVYVAYDASKELFDKVFDALAMFATQNKLRHPVKRSLAIPLANDSGINGGDH